LTHLSGEHAEYFRTLPAAQQSAIVAELWAWYADQGEPEAAEIGPFVGPAVSHGTPGNASVTFSLGDPNGSVSSNAPATPSAPPETSEA
jgi:hypothetical protein